MVERWVAAGWAENTAPPLRRATGGTRFAPLDQFCMPPQRGFASTEEGNILTEEGQ